MTALLHSDSQDKLSSFLNTSLCCMKQGNWKLLVAICDKILALDSKSAKAVYRKGLALKHLSKYSEAQDLLSDFQRQNGTSEEYRGMFAELAAEVDLLIEQNLKKEKVMFKRMFE